VHDHGENPEDYLINYNEKFKDDDPVLFRDSVVEQTLSCLIGRNKPNALLIGAAGVGKTKIVENIAWRLTNNEQSIPEQLRGYTIWELPISNLVNDSGLVGDVERKTKSVLEFSANPDNKVILFIDEIHTLVEIRSGANSYSKIAQIMKPFLARGDMRVIGATTLQESKNLMHDPAFNRRFTRLIVDELSPSQTTEILKKLQDAMVEHYHHRILLGDSVIEDIVKIADEYKTIGSHRPDNALTLLDRSMADAYINYLKKLEEENKTVEDIPTMELSVGQMRKTAMRIMTGNNEKVEVSKETLRKSLQIIKGQDETKDYLLDAIERDNLNVYPRTKPLTILFAGSSGVGKTEVSKILARELTSLEPIILNMTEYNDAASIARIVGAPPGYIGYDSKAELPFDILESNPYQVILLDEFEKADRSVQRLFMSVFDEGYIKTSKGSHVDFTKSIIIATTNAGYTDRKESIGFAKGDSETAGASVSDLSKYFDIELLNRFTKILNFNFITRELYEEIMRDTYRRQIQQIKETKPEYCFMPDELPEEDLDKMVEETYSQEFGARPVSPTVQKYIEDNIIKWRKENS
jgi:ATP-dependent Clp protease ATP-binding subunit ClpA